MDMEITTAKPSSLRWKILRQALLHRSSSQPHEESQVNIERISRRASQGFNLIPFHPINDQVLQHSDRKLFSKLKQLDHSRDVCVCYTLPTETAPKINLIQRVDRLADLGDFEICNRYDIDNTGLVCHWPSEDVLVHFCLSHADMFRSKKVIELGSGYGLAGLVIAAVTEASEVVISDGNPQVVDYIQRNMDINFGAFGSTKVKSMHLHWNHEEILNISGTFDVILASDCTFFKEFHKGLARTVKLLMKKGGPSEAIFFNPKRGNSLDKFLEEVKQIGLQFSITENYDSEVWKRHQGFMTGDVSWPNYEKDHCYPLLVRITL